MKKHYGYGGRGIRRHICLTLCLAMLVSLCTSLPVVGAEGEETDTSGFYTFRVTDGTASIVKCDTSASGAITVPSELGGYPVTKIEPTAFKDCTGITSLVLPEGIEEIGLYAFQECNSLTEMTIPDSVTTMGLNPFVLCESLQSIVVSETHPLYSSVDGVLYNKDKTTLISCPGGKEGTFTVPEGVVKIEGSAFAGCHAINEIHFPDTLQELGEVVFMGCSSLKSIEIPDGIAVIRRFSFWDCTSLTEVVLPDSVTVIADNAFWNCSSLEEITIPKNVTAISPSAFQDCQVLEIIYFEGDAPSIHDNSLPLENNLTCYIPYGNTTYEALKEQFPEINWVERLRLGDINGDKTINFQDVQLVLQHEAGIITLSPEQLKASDVNGDGKTDFQDAQLILQYDAGIIDSLEVR